MSLKIQLVLECYIGIIIPLSALFSLWFSYLEAGAHQIGLINKLKRVQTRGFSPSTGVQVK